MERKLNYKFQTHDSRDYKFTVTKTTPLASSFSLANKVTTVLDQGNLGACVSNAFAQAIGMSTNNGVNISRLFHYYCGRAIEGDSSLDDSGLDIRKAANIIARYGGSLESVWPYVTTNFNQLPPLTAFQKSKLFQKYTYSFVNQDLNSLQTCLVTTNSPIIFGITVYSSFMTQQVANTGIVPMPNTKTETLEGGHCILIVGYNNTTQQFTCLNSWGNKWGNKGFFYLPYAYVTNPSLASDFCSLNFTY